MEFKFDRDVNHDFLVNAKVAIIVGYFYQDIGDKLLAAAHETLAKYGINENNVNVFYAPGAFEIPLLALAQINSHVLLDALVKEDYQVSLETSGSIDISAVNPKVSIVMDVKTPSSNESKHNKYDNIDKLQAKDQLKFVIGSKVDFDWSVETMSQYPTKASVLFSPVFDSVKPTQLADWILDKQLNVRLQVQMHKLLWGDEPGR